MWVVDAIPPALSETCKPDSKRYTTLVTIQRAFQNIGHSAQQLNAAIAKVRTFDLSSDNGDYVLLGSDDKGIVDFVRIAFQLFGYRVQSVCLPLLHPAIRFARLVDVGVRRLSANGRSRYVDSGHDDTHHADDRLLRPAHLALGAAGLPCFNSACMLSLFVIRSARRMELARFCRGSSLSLR
ncbi:MAG: hypothetical protein KatS3mg105_4091 [Gemmatales bacterium]|nr:MAG: hypothetical protein KatS3mg105_4091 [Gemmatales bacterium]